MRKLEITTSCKKNYWNIFGKMNSQIAKQEESDRKNKKKRIHENLSSTLIIFDGLKFPPANFCALKFS